MVRGFELELFFAFSFGLSLFLSFVGFVFFLLLDDLLLPDDLFELFFVFWSSSCASYVLDLKFKLYVFCYQCTHQAED
jgi:hypothetical protein